MGTTDRREPDGEQAPALPRRAIRAVTPPYRGRSDTEMNAVGWAYGLGLVVLLLPLLPAILVVWAISKLLDWLVPRP